jgi:hypothetical protein
MQEKSAGLFQKKEIMKKIFAIAFVSLAFLPACKKAFEQPDDWSSMAVIQASPVSTTIPTDTVDVFVDGMRYNSTRITYNTNSGYLPVLAGTKNVSIRRGVNNTDAEYVSSFSHTFEKGKAYSFVVYDTTTSATAQAKVLRLRDDLTLPEAGQSKVRVLHLAPRASAVDITLLRTSVTPNDSVTISNRSYIGATANDEALSAFMAIPRGVYTAKVKTAGTQTVLLTSTATLLTATATGASVSEGRIVTLYLTGTAKGRPLAMGAFRHY